ncbi:MAG: AmmeMemoRadiSam system protein B [Candidatus Helarchaeota archaeon]|nr:AmmeMemoRadiSam system protein B [Candidatus Helarchaeota archaeon]
MIRKAAYAGGWYSGTRDGLNNDLQAFFETHKLGPKKKPIVNEKGPREIITVVSPHAGYVYSGAVAANSFAALAEDGKPDLFIIIGVNHRSYTTEPASVQAEGAWETPLGQSSIDTEVAKRICLSKSIFENSQIHKGEHSLELQLPFLQYIYGPEIKIVPIMMSSSKFEEFVKIGEALADAITGKNAVIIASTDFTHFEHADDAKKQDQKAIDAIIKIDGELLFNTVKKNAISMCGYASTSVALIASKILGATKVELLKYANSGETSGDYNSVVGYASLIIGA